MSDDKACLFNIQKYSIHDGPGIRTVIFFKGCPLECQWCSNPESQKKSIQITWDKNKCTGCLHCIVNCPNKAINYFNNSIKIDYNKCNSCFNCIETCRQYALKNEGSYYTVGAVLTEVLKDKPFYEESGGGVTLSGGEVLQQDKFAIKLLKKLKEHHIHTACETSGYASNEIFLELIKYLDLVLYDLKHYNREKHYQATGVYNDLIIKNLKTLISQNKNFLVRIPIIPGINNNLDDAQGFSDLMKELGIKRVSLLPFHQFGERKYELLNMRYDFKNVPQLNDDDLIKYKNILKNNDIKCI